MGEKNPDPEREQFAGRDCQEENGETERQGGAVHCSLGLTGRGLELGGTTRAAVVRATAVYDLTRTLVHHSGEQGAGPARIYAAACGLSYCLLVRRTAPLHVCRTALLQQSFTRQAKVSQHRPSIRSRYELSMPLQAFANGYFRPQGFAVCFSFLFLSKTARVFVVVVVF